jgi:acyl carrier protein
VAGRPGSLAPAVQPTVQPTVRPAVGAGATPPSLADTLRDLWRQSVGAPPRDEEDDFFESGGNSLAAVDLMARIRALLGVELSIGLLLETRTFGGLVAVLAAESPRDPR